MAKHKSEEEQRIEEEQKKLDMEKENLALLEQRTTEARTKFDTKSKELEDRIATVCEKWIKQRDALSGEIAAVDAEIADLERKAQEKREERKLKEDSRASVQREVDSVRDGYKDQEAELGQLSQLLKSNEQDTEESGKSIAQRKEQIEGVEHALAEETERRTMILEEISAATRMAEEERKRQEEKLEKSTEMREAIERHTKELYDARLKTENVSKKREFYQEKVAKSDKQVADSFAQATECRTTLSKLEEDKKTFAAARKFKEASKASTDIKTLQTKIQELEKAAEELQKQKLEWAQEVIATEKELDLLVEERSRAECELARASCLAIEAKISELETMTSGVGEGERKKGLEKQAATLRAELAGIRKEAPAQEEKKKSQQTPEEQRKLLETLKEKARQAETEMEELGKKEEFEAADAKQGELKTLKAKIDEIEKTLPPVGPGASV